MKIEEQINQVKPIAPVTKSIINILHTASLIQFEIKKVLRKYDLNSAHYNVLRILKGRGGDCANCNDVKKVLIEKSSDFTRICNKLVKLKLINRFVNPENKREILLELTDKGSEILLKINPQVEIVNKKFNFLTSKEHEKLSKLLDKFRG